MEISGAISEEKKHKKTFIFVETKLASNEKNNYFEPIEEESANYNENRKEIIRKGDLDKKSIKHKKKYESPTYFKEQDITLSKKYTQFNQKSHPFLEPITPISLNSEKSRTNDFVNFSNSRPYFSPTIKKNGEAHHNFNLQTKTDSPSNLKESHKDFSKYGQFIAYDSPTLKTNSLYLKLNERTSSKISKTIKVDDETEFSPKFHNNTLHNASTSVLSNINWGSPSFVLNRPGLLQTKNDDYVNFHFSLFYFILCFFQDSSSLFRERLIKPTILIKKDEYNYRNKVESFGFNPVLYKK